MWLFDVLRPAPRAANVPEAAIADIYRHRRVQLFVAVYLGYALYYVVRKNITVALPPLMAELGLTKLQMGIILSLFDATYAFSKIVNGPLCDRTNPRYFMAIGLLGTALANFCFGFSSIPVLFGLWWILNGFFQSMGSPVGPKAIASWFSTRERGRFYGVWNTCHNLGAALSVVVSGMVVQYFGWRYGFFVPGTIAFLGAGFVAWRMLDRPESVGLPPIQEYHGELPKGTVYDTQETAWQLFRNYVLTNHRIWLLAVASMLIYMVRNGIANWGVTFLSEARNYSLAHSGFTASFFEWMGIPGTLIAGFLADRFFPRRNLVVAAMYLVCLVFAVLGIWLAPRGSPVLDACAFGLCGFLVYGAQMICTGIGPLSMVPRRAAASAVALTGALSYVGSVITSTLSGHLTDALGWHATFAFWAVCGFLAVLVISPLVFSRRGSLT